MSSSSGNTIGPIEALDLVPPEILRYIIARTKVKKHIDFDTLALKGEETIAVGNMGVNARGDKLGEGGEVVKKREEVMADYYRIHNGTIPQERVIPDGSPETALQPDH